MEVKFTRWILPVWSFHWNLDSWWWREKAPTRVRKKSHIGQVTSFCFIAKRVELCQPPGYRHHDQQLLHPLLPELLHNSTNWRWSHWCPSFSVWHFSNSHHESLIVILGAICQLFGRLRHSTKSLLGTYFCIYAFNFLSGAQWTGSKGFPSEISVSNQVRFHQSFANQIVFEVSLSPRGTGNAARAAAAAAAAARVLWVGSRTQRFWREIDPDAVCCWGTT